jgi:hypothetical protein
VSLQLTIGLAIALLLSLIGNAVLGWQWAGAKADCRADMERSARLALTAERTRAGQADETSVGIATIEAAKTAAATRTAQGATHDRDRATRAVPVSGACRMPDGLPGLGPAVDAANAAAGL